MNKKIILAFGLFVILLPINANEIEKIKASKKKGCPYCRFKISWPYCCARK